MINVHQTRIILSALKAVATDGKSRDIVNKHFRILFGINHACGLFLDTKSKRGAW